MTTLNPSETNDEIRRQELTQLAKLARKYMWDMSAQRILQDHGVMTEPNRFYSQLPSLKDIEGSFEYDAIHSGKGVWWNEDLFDLDAIRAVIETLLPFAEEFDPPLEGDVKNPTTYFWNNPAFSFSDAMAYWCFIRKHKPAHIVEIGSGFSTLIASQAIKANKKGRLSCIEPYPMDWLKQNIPDINLIERPIQDIPVAEFNELFQDGDILMIDSTHTVKMGSDCLWIYLKLLPALESDLYIHVHDISLPFAMPAKKAMESRIHWAEMYLLMAYLLENPRVETLFSSKLCATLLRDEGLALMDGKKGAGGGSFWFRQTGRISKGDSFKVIG